MPNMKALSVVACALVLMSALPLAFPSASAASETVYVSSVEAGPGTISGGTASLASSDDSRVTATEADVTANLNAIAWLKPNGDTDPNNWDQSGDCLPLVMGTSQYECVVDDPVQDGNATYLSADAPLALSAESEWTHGDWPLGTDVTFDSVSVWSWVRANSTTYDVLDILLTEDLTWSIVCLPVLTPTLTQAFANYSRTYTAACVGGGAWTLSQVNDLSSKIDQSGSAQPGEAVTASGITVQYDDRDYQVAAYFNFTSLPGVGGYDYVLNYEGYEDLAAESASLQILRDGTWTTIASLAVGADAAATYTILPEESDDGTVRFRVIDSVTDEETGESVYMDLFTITATPQDFPRGFDPVTIECSFAWPASRIRCAATERVNEQFIAGRIWEVDGKVIEEGPHVLTTFDWFVGVNGFLPQNRVYVVNYTIVTIDGDRFSDTENVVADTRILWLVYLLVILVPIVIYVKRHPPKKQPSEPPPRSEK